MGVPNSTRSIKPNCPIHFDVGGFAASIHINTGNGIATRSRSPISSGLGVNNMKTLILLLILSNSAFTQEWITIDRKKIESSFHKIFKTTVDKGIGTENTEWLFFPLIVKKGDEIKMRDILIQEVKMHCKTLGVDTNNKNDLGTISLEALNKNDCTLSDALTAVRLIRTTIHQFAGSKIPLKKP